MADGAVHLFQHRVGAHGGEAGAFAVLDLNDAHAGQGLQGFADGGPADAEALHEVAFGGQETAGFNFALLDHEQQAVQNLIGEFTATDFLF